MCEHLNNSVIDSRPEDYVLRGKRIFKPRDYPYFVRRRRKCSDCGVLFNTVEVPLEYMEKITEKLGIIEKFLNLEFKQSTKVSDNG